MNDKDKSSEISVIIPTADREQMLYRAVDSVLKQSVLPSSIIVVDNGVDEVKIQFDDPRVIIIRTSGRYLVGQNQYGSVDTGDLTHHGHDLRTNNFFHEWPFVFVENFLSLGHLFRA